ncbi:MAG: Gfo/Idh/MocA family oxidoreductase [Planctomycetes bacterium]|nr:Gfo/Idh/MocA family oxidoreductase [Planctomycetota bacterium]
MSEIQARIGFVGCGGHANHRLYPAIKQVEEIELVAVCDIDPQKADATASKWGVPTAYCDLEEMLDGEELDAVAICGRPQMHVDVGQTCLGRGLHIYVEKPSATNSDEAQKLADLASEKGCKGLCGFMKRHSPAYRAARAISQNESFGGVHMAEVRFTQGPYPALWGIEEPMRAFLIGQLVHMFDVTRFLCGDVKSVHARLHQISEQEGAYAVNLQFADGGVGIMNLCALASDTWHFNEVFNLTGHQEWLEVEDQIYLRYHPLEGWLPEALKGERALKNQTCEYRPSLILEHESLELGGYVGEMRDLARCAVTGAEPVASLQDSVEALRIAEAIWESAQAEQEVEIAGV